MFERELERARKGLRDLVSTRDPYVSLQSILGNGAVHPAYRCFFGAEVAWWLHEERALRTSNPRFDTTAGPFKELFAKLDDAYLRHARFDHEELNATIEAAVKTRLNFLCRPRTSLKWFVFRGEPTKPLNEVLLRLSYFHDYQYLTDGIRQWADARRTDSVSSYEILSIVEFERIIEKVDNDAILDQSQDEFVELLQPLYDWFAEHNTELPPESVPTEAVIIFLDDKGAIPISQTLERMLYRENLKILTRSKFLDVIDFVISEIESGAIQGPVTSSEQHEASSEQRVASSEQQEASSELPATSFDLRYDRFGADIDAATRQRFIKRLCGGEDGEFEALLGEVLGSETWKIGAAKLDRWFIRQGVQPNNAVAMELAHALNKAFR